MKQLLCYFLLSFILLAEKDVLNSKEIKLSSGNLSYLNNLIILNKNVVAQTKNFIITSDNLKGFIEKKSGIVERIELRKNVVFSAKNYKAFSQYAIYLPQKNILTLLNSPVVKQDKNVLQAKKIIIYQKENKMILFEPKITFVKTKN